MPRKGLQQPPANYQCPYHNCCPHLQGLSSEFVFTEYQNAHEEYLDHWKARDELNELLDQMRTYTQELEAQNAELKAKLTALHRRQFKANRKQPPATAPQPQAVRKRGAPKGHPGWYRVKPAHIDQTRTVAAPDVCPHCHGTDLTPIAEIKEHLQEDIVLAPRTHVTCFKHHQAFCANCRRPVIQSAEGEMLNCPIGPKTKALAVFLRYGMRVPYEIWGQAVAEDFFHGFSGWLIFMFGLAVLLFEMWLLRWLPGREKTATFHWLDLFHSSNSFKTQQPTNPTNQTNSTNKTGSHQPIEQIEPIKQAVQSEPTGPGAASGWKALLQPPQFIVAVVLLAGTLALAQGVEFREKIPISKSFDQFPLQVGEWTGRRDVMDQKFLDELKFKDYVIVDYMNGAHAVNFYTAYYETQRKGESIHSPETCLPGGGWEFNKAGTVVVEIDGEQGSGFRVQGSGVSASNSTSVPDSTIQRFDGLTPAARGSTVQGSEPAPEGFNPGVQGSTIQRFNDSTITVNRAVIEKGAYKQLSYFWFPMRGRVLTNIWQMKWYTFWDALTRQRTDGALVRLITPVYPNEDVAQAEARLTAFTQAIVPVLNEYLPK